MVIIVLHEKVRCPYSGRFLNWVIQTVHIKFVPFVSAMLLAVLIFGIFSAIRKNNCPQIKITSNIFPTKIYSSVIRYTKTQY